MTDAESAASDPLGFGDPYWQRLWSPDLSPCSVVEGPTYVVAPDLTRFVQVQLALDGAIPIPRLGACEVGALSDCELPDIEGVFVYVRLELLFDTLPTDLEGRLQRLPFKAYRVTRCSREPMGPEWALRDLDWDDVLPNLEWRGC